MKNSSLFIENMEKYQSPEMYDLQYDTYLKDLPLLLEWANRKGGPVVDLACGTGRVTIPIAESGVNIIGIDLNKGMLERAQRKAKEKNLDITWLLQDCSQFTLEVESPFIYMTGNSFQHFLTNEVQDELLQSVHNHLCRDGIFIFGTRFPTFSDLMTEETPEEVYIDPLGRKISEIYVERYDAIEQILHSTSIRKIYSEENLVVSEEKDSISMRFVFPKEMDRLITQNGFQILHKYGTWNKQELNAESKEMIYVCKKV